MGAALKQLGPGYPLPLPHQLPPADADFDPDVDPDFDPDVDPDADPDLTLTPTSMLTPAPRKLLLLTAFTEREPRAPGGELAR